MTATNEATATHEVELSGTAADKVRVPAAQGGTR